MKIIVAHYKYYVQGGPEKYFLKFAELATKHGCEIIPFSINYPINMKSDYSKFFVGKNNGNGLYNPHNHNPFYLWKGFWNEFHNREAYNKLRKLIKSTNADLLYCLIPGELTPDIFKAAHDEGIPSIMRVSDFRLICGKYSMVRDGTVCNECLGGKYRCCFKHKCVHNSKILSWVRSKSLSYHRRHKSYRFLDAIITPPQFTKDLLVQDGSFDEKMIFVNPTFIESKAIEPCYENKNYVLCLGRFVPEKGFKYAIEALDYLRDYSLKLIITGDEKDAPDEISSFIKEKSLEDRVVFSGFLTGEKLKEIIKGAIAIVCPAVWYENMPNVVLEAFAYGKPVIASRIGCFPEFINDSETGFLFEPGNSYELSLCIKKIVDNKELRVIMGKTAREKCISLFSPEHHWDAFISIYNKIKKENHLS